MLQDALQAMQFANLLPHGYCIQWTPLLLWTFVASDAIIGLSYYSIPAALGYFLIKQRKVRFPWMVGLFAVFIFACGTTHFLSIVNLWQPYYLLDAALKAFTALASVITAAMLWPLLPKLLSLPTAEQLESANLALQEQIHVRQQAESETRRLNEQLEERVRMRTRELEEANRKLELQIHERALLENRQRAIIESAPMAIAMADGAGSIILVNSEMERMFDCARSDLIGRNIDQLISESSSGKQPSMWREFFSRPSARSMGIGYGIHAKRGNGSEFPVEIRLNPVEASDGLFVLAAIADITERKRLEDRFRATVESAPTAMVMINREGNIVLVNAETERMFGAHREELIGKPVEALIPMRFSGHHPKLREGFFSNPSARTMGGSRDLYALRHDGSEFPVEIGLNPVNTSEGLFVLAAIADITWRKQAQDDLRRANEELEQRVLQRTAELAKRADELAHARDALERSNLDLQQFAYVTSHDLQTPLRNISGFAQLLQRTYAGKFDKTADDWLQRIVNGTQRMHALVHDLLALSRVDSAARPFEITDMNTVFDDVTTWLKPAIDNANATVTREALPEVRGDATQLAQLLQNLIANGILYRRDEPPMIHASARRDGDHWIIAVRDNGIGIDQKHHERVFEIFQRLHTQREYPGTGIGLAICRRVVNRHGGRIWIESEPGLGSTFLFTLPGTVEEPHA